MASQEYEFDLAQMSLVDLSNLADIAQKSSPDVSGAMTIFDILERVTAGGIAELEPVTVGEVLHQFMQQLGEFFQRFDSNSVLSQASDIAKRIDNA